MSPLLLLVDDAIELGEIVAYLGKRSGIEVATRTDAASAWEFLQTRRPNLVLLDVNLPGMRGPELCRRIRSTPSFADLVIALFSHWGLPADIAEGWEAGADFLVSKELVTQPNAWRQRIEEILADKDSRSATAHVGFLRGEQLRTDWVDALNRSLRSVVLRILGPELLGVVVRGALAQAWMPTLPQDVLARFLSADGFVTDSREVRTTLDVPAAARLLASLTEQSRRLLGAEASRPIREALAGLMPGMSG